MSRAEVRTVNSAYPDSVAALIAEVEKQFGSIDVLHYNAASIRQATLSEQPRVTFVQDLAVNIGGALVATQAVTQQMSERRSGTILLIGGGFLARAKFRAHLPQQRQGGYPSADARHF